MNDPTVNYCLQAANKMQTSLTPEQGNKYRIYSFSLEITHLNTIENMLYGCKHNYETNK